jgi:hypothetical protein
MAECLLHPRHGYYATRDPLGAAGDFTTAPEISQMFGECLGLCLAQAWLDQGAPSAVVHAELDPGGGTLRADVLRATTGARTSPDALQVTSSRPPASLRAEQAQAVPGAAWHDRVPRSCPRAAPPPRPTSSSTALPIRRSSSGRVALAERVRSPSGAASSPGASRRRRPARLNLCLADTRNGVRRRGCPPFPSWAEVGRRIARARKARRW